MAATFVAMDGLWLGVIAKPFYRERMGHLMRRPDEGPAFSLPAAAVVYLLLLAGLWLFVLPKARGQSAVVAALYGACFGAIVYGVYDFTNQAVLSRWPLSLSLGDMAWGAVVCGAAAWIGAYIQARPLG